MFTNGSLLNLCISFLRTSYQNYVIITSQRLTKFITMLLENQTDLITFLSRDSKSAGQNIIKFRGAKLWKEIRENFKNKPFNSFKKQFKENLRRDYLPPGPAPRRGGAFRGCAPPNDCLCPPKRELCPHKGGLCSEEINRFGAICVQFEAKILVNTIEFVGKNCFFADFAINTDCLYGLTPALMKIREYFGRSFFLVSTSEFVEIRTFFGMKTRICANSRIVWNEDLF